MIFFTRTLRSSPKWSPTLIPQNGVCLHFLFKHSTAIHSEHEERFVSGGPPKTIIPTKHPSRQDWYDWMFVKGKRCGFEDDWNFLPRTLGEMIQFGELVI